MPAFKELIAAQQALESEPRAAQGAVPLYCLDEIL